MNSIEFKDSKEFIEKSYEKRLLKKVTVFEPAISSLKDRHAT